MSPRALTVPALIVLVAACAGDGADDPLADGAWLLVEGTLDETPLALVDGYQVTLTIDGNAAGGRAACNLYGATIGRSGDRVTFTDLHQTAAFCPEAGVMELEAEFLAALSRVEAASRDGDLLVLTGTGVGLRFEALSPDPDEALTGIQWSLETLLDREVATTPAARGALHIAEDGTVTGFTGCNDLFGTFDPDTGFHDLTMTERACADDIMRQEAHFSAVLDSGPTLSIEGPILTVIAPDGQGVVFRAAS